MANNNCVLNAEAFESDFNQIGLLVRTPLHRVSRPVGVTKAWSIKYYDPMIAGDRVDQSTRVKVLDHAPIAVQQYDSWSDAALDIVQIDAVDVDEPASWWVVALRLLCEEAIDNSGSR